MSRETEQRSRNNGQRNRTREVETMVQRNRTKK